MDGLLNRLPTGDSIPDCRRGANGVVGDDGLEGTPVCNGGNIEGSLSMSRTGRREKRSDVSVEGTAVAGGWG